jgi:FlaA1/EpsC-like NDP-sugar epimerase
VIVGAGHAGRTVVRVLEAGGALVPVGLIDDDPPGGTVSGLPVLGGTSDIAGVVWPLRPHVAVVAIPSLPHARVAELIQRACEAGLDVRYVPPGGDPAVPALRLLGRDELRVASIRARRFVSGRRVLVTGACGTVGAQLCRRLRTLQPAALLQLDDDARALARLTAESALGRSAVVDIRDGSRVDAAFAELRPELVLHAAGFNHDPRPLERRPSAAVRTNVLGTRNLARAALRQKVERFVLVSTDQAAEPVSVLGATRRLSELVLQAEAGGATCFASVRTGSVLGSGSSPFRDVAAQLAEGRPVTVCHPDATRHLMSAREAAELALEATPMAEDADTFALDTGPPSSVLEVVGALVDGLRVPDVVIGFTGLGPGEHLRSRSFAASEDRTPTAHPLIYATRAAAPAQGRGAPLDALLDAAVEGADDRVRVLMRRILPEYRPREDRP